MFSFLILSRFYCDRITQNPFLFWMRMSRAKAKRTAKLWTTICDGVHSTDRWSVILHTTSERIHYTSYCFCCCCCCTFLLFFVRREHSASVHTIHSAPNESRMETSNHTKDSRISVHSLWQYKIQRRVFRHTVVYRYIHVCYYWLPLKGRNTRSTAKNVCIKNIFFRNSITLSYHYFTLLVGFFSAHHL